MTASATKATIRCLLARATARLGPPDPGSSLEAGLLLAHVLGRPRSHLYAWPERVVSENEQATFLELVAQRRAGTPIAYLLGRREFWSLDLEVTHDTLIPRPETETLVSECLSLTGDRSGPVADLGTGSGAVALALAHEQPGRAVVALDNSPAALRVAQRNRERLALINVSLVQGDWCMPLGNVGFRAIVGNPPYVAEHDPHLSEADVRHEPRSALASGCDGLDAIRRIAPDARRCLSDGWLLLEHGFEQAEAVRALFRSLGYDAVRTARDLEGRERVTVGYYPGPAVLY